MSAPTLPTHRPGRKAGIGLLSVGLLSLGLVGAGGPASAAGTNAVTGVPAFVNIANAGAVEISGTAESGVAAIIVAVDDEDLGTKPVVSSAIPGAASWSTTLDLSSLTDGTLTVLSSFDEVAPASDPTVVKDTVEPDSPLPTTDVTDFTSPQDVVIEALDSLDQARTHYTTGTPAANPTAASPVVPAKLLVDHSQQVKAISYDEAGNASTVTTLDYTVTAPTPSPAPSGSTTPPSGSSPSPTPSTSTPPASTPTAIHTTAPPSGSGVAAPKVTVSVTKVSPAGSEYVSVRNVGKGTVNLKGWKLRDTSGHVLTLPSYSLKPGATVKVYTGKSKLGAGKLVLGKRADVWGTHDTVKVFDSQGVRKAVMRY